MPIAPPVLTPGRVRTAVAHLRRADPRLRRAIAKVGPCRFSARRDGTHFDALVRAIVYQQLSGKAAATIHGRLLAHFGGVAPDAHAILAADEAALRATGLSRQKLGYIRSLAEHVVAGELPLDCVETLADEEIEAALMRVKGIGRWSAQMFLMFRLGRPDVFPESDLGIRKGVQLLDRLRELPTPRELVERAERWAPWRTVAAWYLWRLVDLDG